MEVKRDASRTSPYRARLRPVVASEDEQLAPAAVLPAARTDVHPLPARPADRPAHHPPRGEQARSRLSGSPPTPPVAQRSLAARSAEPERDRGPAGPARHGQERVERL